MEESIFKPKETHSIKFLNEYDYEKIDEEVKLIPLYFEPVFKKIFRNQKLLKKFLAVELNLDNNLIDEPAYFGESVLMNKYGPFVIKTSVILKVSEEKKPLILTFAKVDYNRNYKENKLYELAINYDEKKIFDGEKVRIINRTKKELEYLRKLYSNDIRIDNKNLLLVALTSKTFKELYEITSKIYNKEETYSLMKAAINASNNAKIKKAWHKYKTIKNQ